MRIVCIGKSSDLIQLAWMSFVNPIQLERFEFYSISIKHRLCLSVSVWFISRQKSSSKYDWRSDGEDYFVIEVTILQRFCYSTLSNRPKIIRIIVLGIVFSSETINFPASQPTKQKIQDHQAWTICSRSWCFYSMKIQLLGRHFAYRSMAKLISLFFFLSTLDDARNEAD